MGSSGLVARTSMITKAARSTAASPKKPKVDADVHPPPWAARVNP